MRPSPPRGRKQIALVVVGLLAGLAVALVATAAALDHGLLDRPLARMASAKLGRRVAFTSLDSRLLSTSPRLEVRGLRIGNPAWAGPGEMLTARRIEMRFPWPGPFFGRTRPSELTVEGADLRLLRLDREHSNWSGGGGGGDPFGRLRALTVTESRVRLDDRVDGILLAGTLSHDRRRDPARPLKLSAAGAIQGGAVRLQAEGAPLAGRKSGQPYLMSGRLEDGAAWIEAEGAFDKPFSFKGFDLAVKAKGPNLVVLDYLLDLGTPNSTPFELTARIRRQGKTTRAGDLVARVGESDFSGEIVSDGRSRRRLVAIDLSSRTLHVRDVASFLAAKPSHVVARTVPGDAGGKGPRLFSAERLDLGRFNRRDAVLKIRAQRFVTGSLAPGRLAAEGRLKDGVFNLEPLDLVLPSGRLRAGYTLDVRKPAVGMVINLSLANARLSGAAPTLGGTLDGTASFRLRARGSGTSLRAVIASARGEASLRVTDGDLKRPTAKLLSGALAEAAFASLAAKEARTPLACLVAKVDIGGGRARVRDALMVTDAGSTTAQGGVDLASETVDLRFYGRPRRFALFRTDRPAAIQGSLSDPKVVIKPKGDGSDPPKPPKIKGDPAAFCRAVAF